LYQGGYFQEKGRRIPRFCGEDYQDHVTKTDIKGGFGDKRGFLVDSDFQKIFYVRYFSPLVTKKNNNVNE
jgi:hypothetical protein